MSYNFIHKHLISSKMCTLSIGSALSLPRVVCKLSRWISLFTFTCVACLSGTQVNAQTTPDPPTGVAAVRGPGEAVVSFIAPASNGGSAIIRYTVAARMGGLSTAITANSTSSPIVVKGLNNGSSYTFEVTATNAVGTNMASVPSNEVVPSANSVFGLNWGTNGGGNARVLSTVVRLCSLL